MRLLIAAFAAALLIVPAAGSAPATRIDRVEFPFDGLAAIAVDPSTGRLFVTSNDGENSTPEAVYVFGDSGRLLKRIPVEAPSGLAIRPGARRAYVAGLGAITAIDTQRLRVSRVYRLPSRVRCASLTAWTGGKLWYESACPPVSPPTLASLDVATGSVRVFPGSPLVSTTVTSLLGAARGSVLVSNAPYLNSPVVASVAGGTPRVIAAPAAGSCGGAFALTADGSRFFEACKTPAGGELHDVTVPGLRTVTVLGTWSGATARSPDERTVGVARSGVGSQDADVALFRAKASKPFRLVDLGAPMNVARLAFGRSSKTLYVVISGGSTKYGLCIVHL